MVVIDSFRPNNSSSQIGAVQHTGYYALESSSLIDTVKRMHQQGLMVKCSCNCVSVPQDKKSIKLEAQSEFVKTVSYCIYLNSSRLLFFCACAPSF